MSSSSRIKLTPDHAARNRRLHLREIVDAGDPETPTVGGELRAARMRAGHDLRDIGDALRIRYRHLEALESGQHHELPGKTYAVGFVRAYAEHLGLNPDELVRRFKAEAGEAGTTLSAAAPTATAPRPLHDPAPSLGMRYPVEREETKLPTGTTMILVSLLVIGGAAGWFFSQGSSETTVSEVPPPPAFVEPDPRLLRPHPSVPTDAAERTPAFAVDLSETRAATQVATAADAVEAQPTTTASDNTAEAAAPAETVASDDATDSTAVAALEADAGNATTARVDSLTDGLPETLADPLAETSAEATETALAEDGAETGAPIQLAAPIPVRRRPGLVAPTPDPEPEQQAAAPQALAPQALAPQALAPQTLAPQTLAPETLASQSVTPQSAPALRTGPAPEERGVPTQLAQPAPTENRPTLSDDPLDNFSRIQILALNASWLRVDDGEGQVLIQRRMREGEIFAVPAEQGLVMAARNAGAFQILVDGRPVGRAGQDGEVLSGLSLDVRDLQRRDVQVSSE